MKWCVVLFLMVNCVTLRAQVNISPPSIGERLPAFVLEDVKYSDFSKVNNETYEGKWLFLHFWSLGCSAAVQSLDMADSIQKSFPKEVQVLLIGHKYGPMNEEGLEKVFERKRMTNGYDLSIAYDTVLYQQWSVVGVPSIYIVDPNGVLRYVTSGADLSVKKVRSIIDGHTVTLNPVVTEYLSSNSSCLFDDDIETGTIMYASILTKWAGERPRLGYELDRFVVLPDDYKRQGWSVSFATLTLLYQYAYHGQGWFYMMDTAYYGKVHEIPIIAVSDASAFAADFNTGEGYYNYFLKLPLDKLTKSEIMHEMQTMLEKNFGFHATVEIRDMPVWSLEIKNDRYKRLRTNGGEPKFFGINSVAGVRVRNYLMSDFVRLVTANLPNERRIPYIDNTGIDFRIDANIQTDMTDFESIQEALGRCGLELRRRTKAMNVLVIRDPVE